MPCRRCLAENRAGRRFRAECGALAAEAAVSPDYRTAAGEPDTGCNHVFTA
jgi:hypothetical protein